jgi:hypothetical protein
MGSGGTSSAATVVVRIAGKLDTVTALMGLVVGLTAICPCVPAPSAHHVLAAPNVHACLGARESTSLVRAPAGCCDHAGNELTVAEHRSAAVPPGIEDAGALVERHAGIVSRPIVFSAALAPHPPLVLRI